MKKSIWYAFVCILLIIACCSLTQAATITIPDTEKESGKTIKIPITIENADNIGGMNITISYENTVLTAQSVEKGTLTTNALLEYDLDTEGEIKIIWVSTEGIDGDGSLAVISFDVIGNTDDTSNINVTSIEAADVDTLIDIIIPVQNGIFTVTKKSDTPFPTEITFIALALSLIIVTLRRKK